MADDIGQGRDDGQRYHPGRSNQRRRNHAVHWIRRFGKIDEDSIVDAQKQLRRLGGSKVALNDLGLSDLLQALAIQALRNRCGCFTGILRVFRANRRRRFHKVVDAFRHSWRWALIEYVDVDG